MILNLPSGKESSESKKKAQQTEKVFFKSESIYLLLHAKRQENMTEDAIERIVYFKSPKPAPALKNKSFKKGKDLCKQYSEDSGVHGHRFFKPLQVIKAENR